MYKFIIFLLPISFLSAEIGYVEPWGKDAELLPSVASALPPPRKGILPKLAELIILFHQNILSPVDGPRSHFRPTSSRYMLLAIRRHGLFKGYIMGCDRLLRENDEEWVYRQKKISGELYKWDPTTK